MPLITEITPQKKRKGFYSVFLDGKFAFSLSELELSTSSLKVGNDLNRKEIADFEGVYRASKCYNSALRYLALRPRSCAETREYLLRRKLYPEEAVDRAIKKLESEGYLNDKDFADIWVDNRMRLRPKPKNVIKLELIKKGIDKDIIDSVLSNISEEVELDNLKNIILQKSLQSKYKDSKKITQLMVSRGYRYGLVKKAIEEINSC